MLQIHIGLRLLNWAYANVGKYARSLENGEHPKHRLTHYDKFFLHNIGSTDTVLDIGCADGWLSRKIAPCARFVTGIDISMKNISKAQKLLQEHPFKNLFFVLCNAEMPCIKGTFDVVILSNVLEHIFDRVKLLRALKPISPTLLLRVPMIDRDWITLYKKELGIPYLLDKQHTIEYTLVTLQSELNSGGWEISEFSIQFGETWAVCHHHRNPDAA